MRPLEKLQRREPMLPVDDEKFFIGFLQLTDSTAVIPSGEFELLGREQQDDARNRRLRNRRLVKIPDGRDFGLRHLPLKRFVAALNLGDELADIIVRRDRLGLDAAAVLVVKPADEANLGE